MNSAFHHETAAAKAASVPAMKHARPNVLVAMITATALASAAAMAFAQTTHDGVAERTGRGSPTHQEGPMKIRISVDGKSTTATLVDTEASRDFASMLPMTLTLKDYAGTEKVSDLPRKLTTRGAPSGYTPSAGDISYYAPWGNLAIFYRDFKHSEGLIKLGQVDEGMEMLNRQEPFEAKVELVGQRSRADPHTYQRSRASRD